MTRFKFYLKIAISDKDNLRFRIWYWFSGADRRDILLEKGRILVGKHVLRDRAHVRFVETVQ